MLEVHRRYQFKRKYLTGFDCHSGEDARIFVLTESDEAISAGYDFNLKFMHLIAFLRKRFGKFEYCWVMHRQGDKKRINVHVTYFGKYIDQSIINDWWVKYYASTRGKMQRINNPVHEANYLVKYLKSEGFMKARFSRGWVFQDWWAFSKWCKREFGEYPTIPMVISLSKLSKEGLYADTYYSLYLDSKIRSGKLKQASVDKVGKPALHEWLVANVDVSIENEKGGK